MKRSTSYVVMIGTLIASACIKDEPPNPEADIEQFIVDSSQLTGAVFIDQINRVIYLDLTHDAYEQGVTPELQLSKGAVVHPASGEKITFDSSVEYEVTSASGENKKTYTVQVVNVGQWDFNFENWATNPDQQYQYPLEDDNVQLWSSGNPGVALSGVSGSPGVFPTRATSQGYEGTMAAELQTIKGNTLSEFIGIHLFPGSLYLGVFNASQALANPLAATEFGHPYVGRPAAFSGYYQYTPGPTFWDENGNPLPAQEDQCSLYAVLFNGPERLNGTNVMNSDRVIARATLPDGHATDGFVRFEIPFTYLPDAEIGDNLMVAIVASSSYQGDRYRGAIGSTLIVDSLRIIPDETVQ